LKSQVPWAPDLSPSAAWRGREIAVGQALLKDRFGHLAVQRQALGLLVLFIPAQIQPAQSVEDGVERDLGIAPHVGVVDAQDHDAAVVPGVQPVKDEGARAPDVQKTSGGRRKTNSSMEMPV
jgi:hypothetical protein